MPQRRSSISFPLVFLMMLTLLAMVVWGIDDYTRADFPAYFVFGAGTNAYQVEGAAFEDGRSPSIWDTFTHKGYYFEGNGDIACDHYHKYKEDVQLMVETGLEAYRFSISWSRLIPNGRGPVNPKGLEFYNNLIDELVMHGIQPHVTLYHADTPQVLEDEYGGWLSRKIVKDFTAYADVCFKEFGDRVLFWTTINEPNVVAMGGYDSGTTPPGRCSLPFGEICPKGNSSTEPYIAGHNMLLAHSSTVNLYKKKYKATQHGFVGVNIYASWFLPSTEAMEDVIATQRAIDFFIGWFMHPLVFGDYPETMKKNAGDRIPAFTLSESKLVNGSFDFVGLNHYYLVYVKDNPSSLEMKNRDMNSDMASTFIYNPGDTPPDQIAVTPSGLYGVLKYFKEAYGNPPIYVHENGQRTKRNTTLNDTPRVKFVHAYIGALLDAIRNGSNARGYILWSLLDGFEFLDGYESAYGLYYVDLDDKKLRRHPKLSAKWYSNFLKGKNIKINEMTEAEISRFVSSKCRASDK